jgi:endonuclease-8
MPEGDTLFRTAATMHRWLAGRVVTRAEARGPRVPAERLVGMTIDAVDAKGKNLLVRFDSGCVLRSHLRMTGSWHVYSTGERWRRPGHEARFVLEAGERSAVCFRAPVIELLVPGGEHLHPALTALGPDVLVDPLDLDEVRRRAVALAPDATAGDVLLDQRVAAGIGNVYRCEALFLHGTDPMARWADLPDGTLEALVGTASRLMRRNLGSAGREAPWVHGRAGKPCRRCGTPVSCVRTGVTARVLYWCEHCQPALIRTGESQGSNRPL